MTQQPLPPVLTAAELGTARSALTRWVRSGRLVRVLPGIYVDPARRHEPHVRLRVASAANPAGVFLGHAALHLTAGWPLSADSIEMAGPTSRNTPDLAVWERHVPGDWVVERHGLRCCRPPFAVAHLAGTDDGAAIDRFLREGGRLADVVEATSALSRWGAQPIRRAVVRESRDQPWAASERLLHRILREARIAGWHGNHPVVVDGARYFLDVGFPALKLALEVDGREVHSARDAFERDRLRQNALVIAGWTVLRFTWATLQDPDAVVSSVRRAMQRCRS